MRRRGAVVGGSVVAGVVIVAASLGGVSGVVGDSPQSPSTPAPAVTCAKSKKSLKLDAALRKAAREVASARVEAETLPPAYAEWTDEKTGQLRREVAGQPKLKTPDIVDAVVTGRSDGRLMLRVCGRVSDGGKVPADFSVASGDMAAAGGTADVGTRLLMQVIDGTPVVATTGEAS